jgi:hypothetical protein
MICTRKQVADMTTTTPIIVIPADAAARIAETHARKQREYEQMMQQQAEQTSTQPEPVTVSEPVRLHLADDINDAAISAVTDLFDTYHADDDQPIDWSSFWDRLERLGFTITQTDSPAAMKIQRIVRRLRDSQ